MRRLLALVAAAWLGALPHPARALDEAVHEIEWFVHIDLLGPLGRTLAFYEQLLGARSEEARVLLQGFQGPFDVPCCTRLTPMSVSAFGTPGDGLDVVMTDAELDQIAAFGPGAYLIQSVFCCGCGTTPNTSILGCADTPGDFLVVSLDSEDLGVLAGTIAHERGHNAGLNHVTSNPCQLMAPFSGGSCMSTPECNTYRAKANGTGAACDCLGAAVGDLPLADGSACPDGSGCGLCSGGLCGACDSAAGLQIVSAAGAEDSAEAATDDALTQSPLSGGWQVQGLAAGGAEVSGLAYATRRDVLYGVERSAAGADRLITLDPTSGAKTGDVGELAGQSIVISLAYDPGPSDAPPFQDQLYAIQADDEIFNQTVDCQIDPVCFSTLLRVDPDTAAVTVLGDVDPDTSFVPGGVDGLAFDPASGTLYGSALDGIRRIDTNCVQGVCSAELFETVQRTPTSLAFDPSRDRLLRVGSFFGETFLDVVDPGSGALEERISIDPLTLGGITLVPVPEPPVELGLLASALLAAAFLHPRKRSALLSAPHEGAGARLRRRALGQRARVLRGGASHVPGPAA